MEAIGYECIGEFGLQGRRYYRRPDRLTGIRAYQLHCYAVGPSDIDRHLAFANYLRTYPAKAKGYKAEKIRAAEIHPVIIHSYNNAKCDWTKCVEQEALSWLKPLE